MLFIPRPSRAILGTLLLLAVGLVGMGVILPNTAPLQQAKQMISRSLSKALGFPVKVSAVEITPTGNLRLRRVELTNANQEASFSASAGDILVDISLVRLLRTRDALASINQIRINTLQVDLSGTQDALADLVLSSFSRQQDPGKAGQVALPFPVVVADLVASWQSYTWRERLLTIGASTNIQDALRVTLTRSSIEGGQVPPQLSVAGSAVISATGVRDISIRSSGPMGTINVKGEASFGGKGKWNLTADMRRLSLSHWIGEQAPPVFDASVTISGELGSPQFTVKTGALRWQDWRVDKAQAEVGWLAPNQLQVHSLLVTRRQAAISARGTVSLGKEMSADLVTQAIGVAISELPVVPADLPFTGTASFSGRLTGVYPAMQLTGTARVRDGKLMQTVFTDAQASVRLTTKQLAVDGGKLTLPKATAPTYTFKGSYDVPGNRLNAKVTALGLPATAALAWPGLDWPAAGNVQGDVSISGPLNNLVYQVTAQSSSAVLWDQPLQDLDLILKYQEGTTTIQAANARSAGGKVALSGHVGQGKMSLTFKADGVALDKMMQSALIQVAKHAPQSLTTLQQVQKLNPHGVASLVGTIQGKMPNPTLDATFSIPSAQLVGTWAGGWEGRIVGPVGKVMPNTIWELHNGVVTMGSGNINVAGKLIIAPTKSATEQVRLSGSIGRLSLTQAIPLVRAVVQYAGYNNVPASLWKEAAGSTLSGTWSLAGTPNGRQSLQLTADMNSTGKIAGYNYSAQVTGSGWSDSIQLQRVKIAAAGGSADLQGFVNAGNIRIAGNWSNLPAAVVGVLAGVPQSLSGALSGSIDMESGASGLLGTLAWQAPMVSVDKSQLTQLSGRVKAEGSRLRLEQWRGNAAGRTVTVEGIIPLPGKFGGMLGVKSVERIDLNVTIPRGPLAPLAGWLNLAPSVRDSASMLANLQAQGEARLHIGGALNAPQFDGSASFTGGVFALPAPWGRVEEAAGRADFNGSSVKLSQVTARLLGGKLTAQGEIILRSGGSVGVQGRVDGSLQPKLDGLSAEGDVHLRIDGTLKDPRVSGDVNVRKGDINLTDLPLKPTGGGKGTLNARLDVALNLQQLRVRAASLVDVPVSGALKITGSLRDLGIGGQLHADRGRVNYLGTTFTVDEATADFSPYRGLMPMLSLTSATWVGRNTIALQMQGVPPDLKVRLVSEPPLSQEEILALLKWPGQLDKLGSGNTGEMARGIVDALQGGLELGLMSGIEDVVRNSLGLDEFRLEPDFASRELRVEAGKYLMPRVYMTYGRSLFADPQEDVNLEYQLDNGWKVSAGVGDGGEARVGVEARIRF